MWIFRKVQEGAENLPAEVSRLLGKHSDNISAKVNLLNKLHGNVLTPDKIPDFFLPPRLSRYSLVAAEGTVSHYSIEARATDSQKSPVQSKGSAEKALNNDLCIMAAGKPLTVSLTNYETGLFESPNTRRKESLFHSAFSSYKLERLTPKVAPKLPSIVLLTVSSLESDPCSSADSSPYSSPPPIRGQLEPRSLSRSVSNESVIYFSSNNTKKKAHGGSSSLAPPLRFPLDMLHCQEHLHSEHVLLLPCGGCIRLSASRSNLSGGLATVRIRVISLEGLRKPGDLRPLHCGLTLCLSPGKLQRQHSATIKNCRNPVFNEDFFFTEPQGEERGLKDFSLRVKVLEKNNGLGRATVRGVIVKKLSQLIPL